MNKCVLTVLACLFLTFQAHAEIVTVKATGYGDTYEQAVESALGDAIKQVTGARVSTQSASPKIYAQVKQSGQAQLNADISETARTATTEGGLLRDTVNDKNDTSTTSAELTASGSSRKTFEAGIGSTNDVQSSGKVTSYEVLSQACTDKGCEVQLSVSVEKLEFKSKTAGIERDSIAVVTTGRLRNGKTATQLREAITDKLVKSGRFTVLDRSNDAVFDKELGLLDSESTSDEQRLRLGQMMGADYLLILNLQQAGVATKVTETHVDLTGETDTQVSRSTAASMRYTLVETATRAVKWSDAMSFRSGGNQLSAAIDGFLVKVVGDISEIISPPKVVAVHNGRVVINRGMGSATLGQTYDIYAMGEVLVDPDTGESLGATEENVATIKLQDIKAKVAYGEIVSGSADLIVKGAIARLKAAPVKVAPKKPAVRKKTRPEDEQNIDPDGGVIL